MTKLSKIFGVMALFALLTPLVFAAAASVLQTRDDRIWIGVDGTEINLLGLYDLAFVDDTSATATTALTPGATYYVVSSWKTASDDPGKVTTAISAGTLTVTVAAATTGTCSVAVFGAP
jgi:hypothetical protein